MNVALRHYIFLQKIYLINCFLLLYFIWHEACITAVEDEDDKLFN